MTWFEVGLQLEEQAGLSAQFSRNKTLACSLVVALVLARALGLGLALLVLPAPVQAQRRVADFEHSSS